MANKTKILNGVEYELVGSMWMKRTANNSKSNDLFQSDWDELSFDLDRYVCHGLGVKNRPGYNGVKRQDQAILALGESDNLLVVISYENGEPTYAKYRGLTDKGVFFYLKKTNSPESASDDWLELHGFDLRVSDIKTIGQFNSQFDSFSGTFTRDGSDMWFLVVSAKSNSLVYARENTDDNSAQKSESSERSENNKFKSLLGGLNIK